jgi:hypothetical protein
MVRSAVSLEVIDIATPCPADWDAMRGGDRVRFCGHCSLNVYNLSAMPRGEAERLVRETEGRVCVRLYRRADGTVVTADCEGAMRLAVRRAGRLAKTVTAMVITAALAPLGFSRWLGASPTEGGKCVDVTADPPAKQGELAVMGDIAMPAVPPPPPAIMGKMLAPPRPLMGTPVPLPPATQPAVASPPTTQPARP